MTDKKRIADLQKRLTRTYDQRNQCLTALRSAKRIIKIWYDKANGDMGQYFWDEYEQKTFMKRINKALKDGKV